MLAVACANIYIRGLMSRQDLVKLVHAFIFSRPDYCNDVLTGLPKKIHQTPAADSEYCCLSPNKNQKKRPTGWRS